MTSSHLPQRDTRIDVFRALALLTIYVNHVPGTVYEHFTHKNVGFSDAAEAFVLISGISAGLAYGSKFVPGSQVLTALKAMRRAGVLYVTHMMTTLATLAIFALGSLHFARPDLLAKINIERLLDQTAEGLLGLVTLGHQLGYNNILSMYAVVLLMLPLFLLLGRLSLKLMLAVSATLWLAAGIYQVAPPNYPGDGVWFLNPLSWQFLFVIGLAGMMHVKRGGTIPFHPALALLAAGWLLLSLAWVRIPLWGVDASFGLPAVLTGFNKTYLSAPRLLHVLAAAYLIVSIPQIANLARLSPSHPLAVLGRYALPVFIAGTLLSMVAQVLREVMTESLAFDTLLIAGAVALQFALAYWLDWLPTIGWGGRKATPMASKASSGAPAAALRPAS